MSYIESIIIFPDFSVGEFLKIGPHLHFYSPVTLILQQALKFRVALLNINWDHLVATLHSYIFLNASPLSVYWVPKNSTLRATFHRNAWRLIVPTFLSNFKINCAWQIDRHSLKLAPDLRFGAIPNAHIWGVDQNDYGKDNLQGVRVRTTAPAASRSEERTLGHPHSSTPVSRWWIACFKFDQ